MRRPCAVSAAWIEVERVERDAVRLLRHPHHLGLHVAEGGDRARIGRQLDQDDVPGIHEHPRDQIETLL